MLNENHFTKDAYEDNGRCQIHPLNSEGLEAYLSKDSYNYHFLKSKYDPSFFKQIQEELEAEKAEQKNMIENTQNTKNENEKEECIKEQPKNISNPSNNPKQIQKKEKPVCKNTNKQKTLVNTGKTNKKLNNNCQDKKMTGNKVGKIGEAFKPVISNVKNDRGRLQDYPKPYHH